MASMNRFPIRSYVDDFLAGRCANGDQVLLGLLCPNIVLYRFTYVGELIRREVRPWKYPAVLQQGKFNIYNIHDPLFQVKLSEQVKDWRAELGFIEDRIEIAAFYDHELCVGIELPENGECAFLFWWSKDYWMDDQGSVEST